MSELSVNDHLEGILSDFEALKRSFDIEDVDDIPSFASASPVSSPLPPASPHFFMNHTKAAKVAVSQSPAGSYSSSSVPYPSHMNPAPDFSPLPRPRAVVTSLSFNKGSTKKTLTHNNGSSVTRAASFQSRFSPNGYSAMFGAGSDNDSLHSSTSSLEYSGGGSKLLSYPSPRTPDEYHHISQQHVDANFNPRKFSPGPESGEVSSKPILDLHSPNGEGGVAVGRNGAGGRLSPGFKFANANANWNGHFRNASSFGEENHSINNHSQKQAAPSKDRKTPQLNKFPLDLDSIVSPPSASPKPCVRSPKFQQRSPCSGVASPSASLSSLDSSDTPPLSLHQSYAPTTPPGSRPVPEVSSYPVPLSPAQTPHLEILSGPQVGQLDSKPSSYSVSSPSSPRKAPGLSEVDSDDVRDSVGSILQRIASFSQSALHSTPMNLSDRRNGTSPSFGHLTMPSGPPEHQKESAGDLELVVPMEDQEATPTSSSSSSPEGKRQDIVQAQDGSSPGTEHMDHGQVHMDISSSEGSPLDDNTLGLGPQGWDSSSREAQSQEPLDNCRERLENGVHTGTEDTGVKREGPLEPCLTDSLAGLDISYISGSDLFGYVGIEAVLDQMRRKTMKAGFEFNVMVVGQSGLGKSTLVNTLFKSKVSRKSCTSNYQEKIPKTVKIHSVSHMIEEKGVKMKLTVVDTPGFGDQIDNSDCWEPIVKYVNEQYEKYLREELNVMRKRRIPDTRVHCCVYFLPATGHRLRAIDVEFMKHLGSIVSIVPVIAKADTLTLEERLEFKQRIRQDLAANGIQVYPQKQYDEDQEEQLLNNSIRECIPFAVVGTDREHQVNGNKVLGRKTKWGIIEVENAAHCEFSHLRDLLIRSHLQDLKDVTHNVLYETYRVRRLNQANVDFSELELAPIESLGPLLSGTPDKCETESHL